MTLKGLQRNIELAGFQPVYSRVYEATELWNEKCGRNCRCETILVDKKYSREEMAKEFREAGAMERKFQRVFMAGAFKFRPVPKCPRPSRIDLAILYQPFMHEQEDATVVEYFYPGSEQKIFTGLKLDTPNFWPFSKIREGIEIIKIQP